MAKCDDSISEEDPLVDSSCDEEGKIIIIHDPRDEDSINKEVDPLLVSDSLHHRTSPGSPSPLTCIEPQGFVLLLALISALGGFLFGYDTGVVSGAIIMIRDTFSLKSLWLEIIVSGTIAAAAVSAFLTGFINDLIGRKLTLIAASIIFTIGSVILGVSYHPYMLLIGRVIVGVGIGMAASTVPMYIAESAPVNMRGRLVVLYVLFITGGQFVATVVDGAFSYLQYNIGWRFMLGLAGIPSTLMFIGLLYMPESPRWLVFHGHKEKARLVLRMIRPPGKVDEELETIQEDFNEYKKSRLG